MFEPLFDALGSVLNFFYTLVPSYGLAIIGLTVLVMIVITPLTVKSTRSMLEMQRLQPEMKRIQEKYKNDRETMNAELMAFYKEHKINPLGGCLPLLAQMPVFIIMYRLMRGLTVRSGGLGTGLGHIAGQSGSGDALTPWVFTDQVFNPEHLNPDSAMYKALSKTSDMNFLGMDLSLSTGEALKIGLLISIPYFLLLGIMLATGLIQNRQLQRRNTGASVNPQQQMIMKIMPFFLPIISFGFPAGLALYWCTQNVCRIATNQYITHSIYAKRDDTPIEAKARDSTSSSKSAAKKSSQSSDSKAIEAKTKPKKGSSSSKADAGASDRGPGKSVKSQKAHEKTSGTGDSSKSGSGGRKSGTGRKSGERRR